MSDQESKSGESAGTQLAPLPSSAVEVRLREQMASAGRYREKSRADGTIRVYTSAWEAFARWCDQFHIEALPADPAAVATYLAWMADEGLAHSTISRHSAAIDWKHRTIGHPKPTARDDNNLIRDVLSGIRRDQRNRQSMAKVPVQAQHILKMLAQIDGNTTRAHRDRAILTFGIASAMRRSEIVALELSDIAFVERGMRVDIRHSKTDQEGRGEQIAIPNGEIIKPVYHLQKWIEWRGQKPGPLFTRFDQAGFLTNLPMSDRAIARLVKQYALKADLDPRSVAAHSMRAGFLTDAAEHQASIRKMQEVSRHKSVDILMTYIRSAESFDDHAGDSFL
ncbi:site-specific integrase [Croceicoccus gelatinilyticus]|uniref:site-specific integrase n=1 Tax=Croceicoccus gelatinilyticus TaxID=2835536 RepID=UPI001BCD19F2|nr:site-specific integrase [Croceicoccus gelatinilyticus]MBS7671787.1 tyrosine-type recombinase/integrase [Croceicoccus gelatinilyticus]